MYNGDNMYNGDKLDILSLLVMYYSLFGIELFNNKKEIMNLFPKNVFGIFTTIKRHHTLKEYPKDVHGCIGYWDNNYKSLKNNALYDHLLRVSYDSMWKDERHKFFPSIETDSRSILEIDFMLNPIYEIDKNNGNIIKLNTKFNNKKYGIIIQSKNNNNKATYLPDVFPDISWTQILDSIKRKAGITAESSEFQVFAYKIYQIKSSYIDILTKQLFAQISIMQFSKFLIKNKDVKSPYLFPYSCNKNKLIWNTDEQVRNISILGMIYEYTQIFNNIATDKEIEQIKYKIDIILKNLNNYDSQAISFLGFVYQLHNINNIDNREFCNKLTSRLPMAESDFELPEIMIGLKKAGCNIKPIIFTFTRDDSIFKMNWIIQSKVVYNQTISNNLIEILIQKINEIMSNKKNEETNFIAVAFEALCFVYKSSVEEKKNYKLKETILNKMFELLYGLEQRKNCNHNLYAFLNKTSRIDITGHVMNGLSKLI